MTCRKSFAPLLYLRGNILISEYLKLTVEAVKRPHFFAQPVDVPFVFGEKDMFGLTCDFSAKVGNGQSRGFVPDTAELTDAGCGHNRIVFVRLSEIGLNN